MMKEFLTGYPSVSLSWTRLIERVFAVAPLPILIVCFNFDTSSIIVHMYMYGRLCYVC